MNKFLSRAKKQIKVLNSESTYSGRAVYSASGWDGLAKIMLWIVLPLIALLSAILKWQIILDYLPITALVIILLPIIMKQIK